MGLAVITVMSLSLFGAAAALVGLSSENSQAAPPPESSLSRARRLLDEGMIAEARKLFEEEHRRDVHSVEAIRGLALCARDEGDDESALHYFQKLTALAPKDRAAWRQVALVANRLGRDMEALSAAQTALSLSPKGDPAMNDLMTRLVTADKGLLEDPLMAIPDPLRGLPAPGRKGPGVGSIPGPPRHEVPDPTQGIHRIGKDE